MIDDVTAALVRADATMGAITQSPTLIIGGGYSDTRGEANNITAKPDEKANYE